jgi:hypothetical protein
MVLYYIVTSYEAIYVRTNKYANTVYDCVGWTWFFPFVGFITHRMTIANKYAVLSKVEHEKYFSETNPTKRLVQMFGLNLITGYFSCFNKHPKGYAQELGLSSMVSGLTLFDKNFIIEKPKCEGTLTIMKHWQAMLLGRCHIDKIDGKEIPLELSYAFTAHTHHDGTMYYTLPVWHVASAITNWAEKCEPYKAIARSSIIGNILLALMMFLPLMLIAGMELHPKLEHVDSTFLMLLILYVVVYMVACFLYVPTVVYFLRGSIIDACRRYSIMLILLDMLRSTDFDNGDKLIHIGKNEAQCRRWRETVVEYDDGSLHLETRNDDQVARAPPLFFGCYSEQHNLDSFRSNRRFGEETNIYAWTALRCCMDSYAFRWKDRLDNYATTGFTAFGFLLGFMLLVYLHSLQLYNRGETPPRDNIALFSTVSLAFLISFPIFGLLLMVQLFVTVQTNKMRSSQVGAIDARVLTLEGKYSAIQNARDIDSDIQDPEGSKAQTDLDLQELKMKIEGLKSSRDSLQVCTS